MTKDVELHSVTWSQIKGALSAVSESSSSSGNSYVGAGYYSTSKQGFSKRIDDLVKISEKAKKLIDEQDTDGVVSYSYHDDRTSADTLQGSLEKLEKYSNQVSNYLKDKIDHPFYEAMDKVGARLEALSISRYSTRNTAGFKRTETVKDAYGHPMGTREVRPDTIGLTDLYKVESPYKASLEKSYQEFKSSDAYKDHKITQDDYLMAMHHTRAFSYESISDHQETVEMWRDLALGAGVVILTIFCPPAGAVAGVALASADMYSATTGKDWGTGRQLDDSERILRGSFALFDIIPGIGYINDLAKSGSRVAAKGIIKQSLKEGFEQGAKNLDSFKGVLKKVGQFGDNVLTNVKSYAKQVDNLLPDTVTSVVDNISETVRHLDLNKSVELVSGSFDRHFTHHTARVYMPSSQADEILEVGGKSLIGSADNSISKVAQTFSLNGPNADSIASLAKNLDASVDEVVESVSKTEVSYGEHIIKGPRGKKLLAPNVKYVSEEGYAYTTDSLGRITSVNADNLILETADRNLYSQRTVGGIDRLPEDDGGHLIASMFKGSGDIDNLVAMHKDINRSGGEWYAMEKEWRDALTEIPPRKVSDIHIEPIYSDESLRPIRFKVSYQIEGEATIRLSIKNFPKGV